MRCTALLKSTVQKTLGGCGERKRRSLLIQLLVYLLIGSIITYYNSVDGSLSVIRLSSAKWPTRNARVILVNPRCLSPSFPAAVAPSSQITCVLFLLNIVFATALPSQNLKQASLFLGLEFALNMKF